MALRPVFERLSERLSGEYGGVMDHLWINFELFEMRPSPPKPFRFQRRVSGRSRFGLPPLSDWSNVGHFSVKPDFVLITKMPKKRLIEYALSLMYEGTSVLISKSGKLGGFDADQFRQRFVEGCAELGYRCKPRTSALPCERTAHSVTGRHEN